MLPNCIIRFADGTTARHNVYTSDPFGPFCWRARRRVYVNPAPDHGWDERRF